MNKPTRLVIIVRADPVICGHSVEARNLAETALERGFTDVRIVTWPIERLEVGGPAAEAARPRAAVQSGHHRRAARARRRLQGARRALPGGHHRPARRALHRRRAHRVPVALPQPAHDRGRRCAAGRVEHGPARQCHDDRRGGRVGCHERRALVPSPRAGSGRPRTCSRATSRRTTASPSRSTPGSSSWSRPPRSTRCTARASPRSARRASASRIPAIDSSPYLDLDDAEIDRVLAARGLSRGSYVLFLSRLARAKGVDDLIRGIRAQRRPRRASARDRRPRTRGRRAARAGRRIGCRRSLIDFLDDVGDAEKPYLMAGCAAFVLPSKPRPEFVETFGIAIAEQMLAGGGPVITTDTGGIGEAGRRARDHHSGRRSRRDRPGDRSRPSRLPADEVRQLAERARAHALQFDRANVFDRMFARVLPESGRRAEPACRRADRARPQARRPQLISSTPLRADKPARNGQVESSLFRRAGVVRAGSTCGGGMNHTESRVARMPQSSRCMRWWQKRAEHHAVLEVGRTGVALPPARCGGPRHSRCSGRTKRTRRRVRRARDAAPC